MEFKRGDKVISKSSGRLYIVVKNTTMDSLNIEVIAMLSGKWIKTITTKNKFITKD